MRGDRLVERQEPDGGLTLLAVLSVKPVEHFLDRSGRAEELLHLGDDGRQLFRPLSSPP